MRVAIQSFTKAALIDTKKKGNNMNDERKELVVLVCKCIAKNILYYYAAKQLGLTAIPLVLIIEFM